MKKIVEVKKLHFGYGNFAVLEDINLSIVERDYILVIGPNGGGKTTLLKLILGIIAPWKGSIHINEEIVNRIGYVPQYSSFNKDFPINVFHMVLTGRIDSKKILRRYQKDDIEQTKRILDKLNLYNIRDRGISTLSGGQLQRVLLARALVSNPVVLLLDEPTASIDITSKANLSEYLNALNEEMSVVVVTHDPTPFVKTYKHIACINRQLYYHDRGTLDSLALEKVYGCPVELLGHGIPHIMLDHHCS